MKSSALVILINLVITLVGIAILKINVGTVASGESGVFLLMSLPILVIQFIANLLMFLVAIFVKAEQDRALGYGISALLLVLGGLLLFRVGIMTMGKIGG